MEQMRQNQNMDLFDDQTVEVLGMDGTSNFSAEAVFGSSAVVQMEGEGMLDVEGIADDAPFWVDTLDMPEVTSVLSTDDLPFQVDGDADLPLAQVEVMAEPLEEPVVEGETAEVVADAVDDTVADGMPAPEESLVADQADGMAPSVDDVADDTTLMADAF
ncbi:MAG: hypothetical protein IKT00_10890 [Prevotella sp.]|nr:hypothetical protein [Prevotella sp.]